MIYNLLTIYMPIILFIWLPVSICFWAVYKKNYWKRRNIPHVYSAPLIGSLSRVLSFKCCVAEQLDYHYVDKDTKDEPFVGMHLLHKPAILIKHPELIKRILINDFSSFSNRHSKSDIHTDILGSLNLFFLPNPGWKQMRSRLSPSFTSGRMKQMFYLMKNVGQEFNEMLSESTINEKTHSFRSEMKDLCARYTTDVIASCAFGVDAHSLKNPGSDFRKYGKQIFTFTYYRAIEFFSTFFLPEIVPWFHFKVFTKGAAEFLIKTINYIMAEREASGSIKNDLIDTLITLKNEDKNKHSDGTEVLFRGDALVAQAAVFFTGGFETTSAVMSFGLYELALRPELQERLREEIRQTIRETNDDITYDVIQNMAYLNMVILECLRLYPPLPFLDRICTNEEGYSLLPYSDFVIPKGMPIFIPTYSVQRDPKHFPNPKEFDPERFSPENKENIVPQTYIPFGDGPHNCIGERFGLMQAKIGFVNFFKNHYVTPTELTPRKIKLDPKALVIHSLGGIELNIVSDPLKF